MKGIRARKTVPGRENSKQTPVGMNYDRADAITGPRASDTCASPLCPSWFLGSTRFSS